MKPNKIKLSFFAIALLLMCYLSACKKESSVSNNTSFLKTYPTDIAAKGAYFEQLPDGGYIILGSQVSGQPILIRTDGSGNLKWEKVIRRNCFATMGPNTYFWNALKTGDAGHLFLQSNGTLSLIDTVGNLNDSSYIVNPQSTIGYLATQLGTDYILPTSDGLLSGNPSVNNFFVFDQNLKLQQTVNFKDLMLGGKTLTFIVSDLKDTGNYSIIGTKFPRKYWTWSNNSKIFAAKISGPNHSVIQTIIDSGNVKYSDGINNMIITKDSCVLIIGSRTDITTSWTHPIVLKIGKNMNVLWLKDFESRGISTLTYISPCRDGGWIAVGTMGNTAFQSTQSYILKIDKDGNKLWDKTVTASGTSWLYYCAELNDGGYGFIGYSNSFGYGLPGYRLLFVKTDANGNL